MNTYIGIVHHDPTSAWGITFPDLPGCFSAADEFADLPEQAKEAVSLWVESLLEDGGTLPKASTFAQVAAHEDAAGAVSYLPVPAPESTKCIRVNITLPEPLVQRIDARVGQRQRSAFLASAARQALEV